MTQDLTPVVSVVIPMLDERGYIERCLEGFSRQTYPLDRLDLVIVDGGSTDGSRIIADAWAARHPWVRVVENPRKKASAAFNIGIGAAGGDIVCLFSAHGEPDPTYVERSVEVLRETGAAGVGGAYRHEGLDPVSNAIGLAMVSPFGMASPHRLARSRRDVDTISHPAYERAALLAVGVFDESLQRNSDYEMNYRLRAAGYRLVFDPSIGSLYRPRPSLRALAKQFWWYGRWKARVVDRHPGSLQLRHTVPPAAVAGAIVAPAASRFGVGRRVLGLAGLAYAAIISAAVITARPRQYSADPWTMATAIPIMHGAWGAGFLFSLIEGRMRR